jgi:hypothetical protein
MTASFEIQPSRTGHTSVSVNLGRLEAGKVHEVPVEVMNIWKFKYEVIGAIRVKADSDMVDVMMAPSVIKAGESGKILLSVDIPFDISEPIKAGLEFDGRFVIEG